MTRVMNSGRPFPRLILLLPFVALCGVSAVVANFVGAIVSAQRLVEAAQQEGARFPRGNPQAPPRTFGSIGTPDRKCVEFLPSRSAFPLVSRRSGEFKIGGQIAALKAGRPGKVWWNP